MSIEAKLSAIGAVNNSEAHIFAHYSSLIDALEIIG
jgi:hypothetical protein